MGMYGGNPNQSQSLQQMGQRAPLKHPSGNTVASPYGQPQGPMQQNYMVVPASQQHVPSAKPAAGVGLQIPNPLTQQGANQIDALIKSFEEHLTQQLRNHKLFLDDIQSIEEERNFYYRKLRLVEEQC